MIFDTNRTNYTHVYGENYMFIFVQFSETIHPPFLRTSLMEITFHSKAWHIFLMQFSSFIKIKKLMLDISIFFTLFPIFISAASLITFQYSSSKGYEKLEYSMNQRLSSNVITFSALFLMAK